MDTPTSIAARLPSGLEPSSEAAHYGLIEPPFSVTPAHRFVYPSRAYSAAGGQLAEALRRGEGVVVLTGESGTGKTTLCRTIVHSITAPLCLSLVDDPLLTAEDMLKQVLHDFGTGTDGVRKKRISARATRYDLMMALRRFLLDMPPEARAVVVVDDAHNLQPSLLQQLRTMANLETDSAKLMQIVLVGQPSLEALLQHPDAGGLGQRVARVCRLGPLAATEVGAYIDYRLTVAQRAPDRPPQDGEPQEYAVPTAIVSTQESVRFTTPAVQTLAAVSGGVPRTLNLLCDRALARGFARETTVITREIVLESAEGLQMPVPIAQRVSRTHILALVAAVLVVAAGGIWIGMPAALKPAQPGAAPPAQSAAAAPAPMDAPKPPSSPVAPTQAAAPPAAPAPTPAPSVAAEPPAAQGLLSSADAYLVIAGSMPDAQHASDLSRKYLDLGLPAFVRSGSDGRWHALVVGPYASLAEAQAAQQRVAGTDFPDPAIRLERR